MPVDLAEGIKVDESSSEISKSKVFKASPSAKAFKSLNAMLLLLLYRSLGNNRKGSSVLISARKNHDAP